MKARALLSLIPLLAACNGTEMYTYEYPLRAQILLPNGQAVETPFTGGLQIRIESFTGLIRGQEEHYCTLEAPEAASARSWVEGASDAQVPANLVARWDTQEVRIRTPKTYSSGYNPNCRYFRDTPTAVLFDQTPHFTLGARLEATPPLCAEYCGQMADIAACLTACQAPNTYLVTNHQPAVWRESSAAGESLRPGDEFTEVPAHFYAALTLTGLEQGREETVVMPVPLTEEETFAAAATPVRIQSVLDSTCLDSFDDLGRFGHGFYTLGTTQCADEGSRPAQIWNWLLRSSYPGHLGVGELRSQSLETVVTTSSSSDTRWLARLNFGGAPLGVDFVLESVDESAPHVAFQIRSLNQCLTLSENLFEEVSRTFHWVYFEPCDAANSAQHWRMAR